MDMYSVITQVKLTAEIQYTSFLDLYLFVATLEFVLILLITPALTAGAISGERERQTLDLMMTTRLKPGQLVRGKLMSSFSTVLLLMISSFPVLSLVFIYGGVTLWDVVQLLLSYGLAAWLVGCIGIFCSCVCQKSTIATVAAYSATGILTIGTILLYRMEDVFLQMSAADGSGFLRNLLLFNPICTFERMLTTQMGNEGSSLFLGMFLGNLGTVFYGEFWEPLSVAAQLGLSLIFLRLAIGRMTVGQKKGKRRKPEGKTKEMKR